jgi:hypothetical protein
MREKCRRLVAQGGFVFDASAPPAPSGKTDSRACRTGVVLATQSTASMSYRWENFHAGRNLLKIIVFGLDPHFCPFTATTLVQIPPAMPTQ